MAPDKPAETWKSIDLNTNYDQVLPKIVTIVTTFVKDEMTVNQDTGLQADIRMASLQVMELVLEVEDEFDISFPLNRLADIHTVRDLTQEVVIVLNQ